MTVRILTDSTCDLPADLVERYQIAVVPAVVNVGSHSMRDEVDLTRADFYRELAGYDPYPTTSAAAPGEYAAAYSGLVESGKAGEPVEIVAIHIASGLSGILNASQNGARLAGVDPLFVDSGQLSMGLGLQVLAAARLAEQGESAVAIQAHLLDLQQRLVVYALIDSLHSLRRSGRVNWLQLQLGTILQLRLLIKVHLGKLEPIARIRTRARALAQLVELTQSHVPLAQIAFLNTNAADFDGFRGRFTPLLTPETEQFVATACPAIGVHVGPQAVAIACVTHPR